VETARGTARRSGVVTQRRRAHLGDSRHGDANKWHLRDSHLHAQLLDGFTTTGRRRQCESKTVAGARVLLDGFTTTGRRRQCESKTMAGARVWRARAEGHMRPLGFWWLGSGAVAALNRPGVRPWRAGQAREARTGWTRTRSERGPESGSETDASGG
jgi:hypothetical protein